MKTVQVVEKIIFSFVHDVTCKFNYLISGNKTWAIEKVLSHEKMYNYSWESAGKYGMGSSSSWFTDIQG